MRLRQRGDIVLQPKDTTVDAASSEFSIRAESSNGEEGEAPIEATVDALLGSNA